MAKSEAEVKDALAQKNKYLWIIILSLGGLVYITSFWFPDVLLTYSNPIDSCPEKLFRHLGFRCEDLFSELEHFMVLEVDSFGPENLQAQVKAQMILQDTYKPTRDELRKLHLALSLLESYYMVNEDDHIVSIIREKNTRSIVLQCTVKEGETPVCPVQTFTELPPPKTQGKLVLVIKLLKGYVLRNKFASKVNIAFQTFNPNFLKFMSSFKWILSAIALISLFSFKSGIARLPQEFLSNEQNFLLRAGYFLVLFTQPFFNYTNALFLVSSTLMLVKTVIAIAIMQAQTCVLLYFWFSLLQKLISKRNKITSLKKKFMIVLLLIHFGASCVAYYFIAARQAEGGIATQPDPSSDFNSLIGTFNKYFYLVTAIIIIWSAVKVLQIWPKIKDLESRDSFAFIFSFSFMICYIYFIGSGSLEVLNLQGPRVALLYGGTTLYIVLLQVVYTPFQFEIEEAKEKHKYANPQTKSLYENLDEAEAETPGTTELQNFARPTDEENRG